jgi:hypothetical protein
MEKTYYTIYKITNRINGKIYIGSHKTKNLNDNYMGSGKYLKYAQDKYGIEKFEKEILFVFDTAQEMYAKEAEIVNVEFLAEHNTYNIKVGGFGGWDHINNDVEFRTQKNQLARARAQAAGASDKAKLYNTERRRQYDLNPARCASCSQPLDFLKRKNKFCGHSCSAKLTNTTRVRKSNK